ELVGADPKYSCCTFRGSVVALDANTGNQLWKTYTIGETPKPTTKNRVGTQLYGPSGAAVWSSPTLDLDRGMIYIGTGDSYSEPAAPTSDAIMAIDLESGAIKWVRQLTSGDAWNLACGGADSANCPPSNGPGFDFRSPPILVTLPSGLRRSADVQPRPVGGDHGDSGDRVLRVDRRSPAGLLDRARPDRVGVRHGARVRHGEQGQGARRRD